MLGRTANDLFWLSRYVERAENMARLIEAGYRIALLPRVSGDDGKQEWASTLESAGCAEQYRAKHGEIDTRSVVDFLLFDASNSSSIHTCFATARRNARAQRTALTREMWESLNSSWLEFQTIRPETLRADALPRILDWIKERSAGYRGALLNTILRNDTYYFSQLGTFLERADNTARILDVKYYVLLPSTNMIGSGVDTAQWESILRSVSAHRSYRWVYKDSYRSWRIADYLILNRAMPRSLRACYSEIDKALDELSVLYGEGKPCLGTAKSILATLDGGDIEAIFQSGLHEFLLDFVARNNRVGHEISEAYYFNA
ncbi:MAG: alpha-E domain-containing protein [Hyphomicrobium sp.]|uniref:alpha-E domain-containing protein n=1 Tax=Hyphomicrobium sp. TaxID=82 RepID=UPI003D0FFCD1